MDWRLISRLPRQHGPDSPRQLVRHCSDGNIEESSSQQIVQPWCVGATRDHGSCAVHQQRTQISVTSFAQAQLSYAPTSSGLSWHQTKPCGKFPAGVEGRRIADGRNGRSCSQQADTGNFGNALAFRAVPERMREATLQHGNVFVDRLYASPLLAQTIVSAKKGAPMIVGI